MISKIELENLLWVCLNIVNHSKFYGSASGGPVIWHNVSSRVSKKAKCPQAMFHFLECLRYFVFLIFYHDTQWVLDGLGETAHHRTIG
jgi:hypothetical protein